MNFIVNEWCLGLPADEVRDSPNSWNIKLDQDIDTSQLQFNPSELQLASTKKKIAVSAGQNDVYDINAEIIFVSPEVCIVDFGLLAVCQTYDWLPRRACEGSYLAGEIHLCMAPSAIVPVEFQDSLRYRWRVNRIRADHTPPTQAQAESGPYLWYDHKNPKYVDVDQVLPAFRTEIIGYLLDCTLLER